jgi:tetratricopeptide (TPR) repeat protein
VDNATGDPQTGYLGDTIASSVAATFRTAQAIKVLPRVSTAPFAIRRTDYAALKQDLGAEYVLDITMKSALPKPELVVRLLQTAPFGSLLRQTIGGAPGQIEQQVIAALAPILARDGRQHQTLRTAHPRTDASRSDDALLAYVEARALLDRADVTANVGRAIERLEHAVAADPQFVQGHAALGAVLVGRFERTRDRQLLDRANTAISTALKLDADSSAARYAFGYFQYATGARDAAAASLLRAIALDPDNDDAHRILGWRVFVNQGRTDDAIAELREAVRIRPESFENHYRLGNVLFLAGHYDDAVTAYHRATELQPGRADAFTNLGAAYFMLGDVTQATGNYEHAIGTGAGDALAYGNLAVAYYFQGRYKDALAMGLEAIKRDPNRASSQRDLGDYYAKLGRRAEARDAYLQAVALARRSLQSNSRDAPMIVLIAICEAHLGDRGAAERHVAEALTLSPRDLDILFRSAKTYAILGNRAAALERLQMAVERGYPAPLARADPELSSLKSSKAFEDAINAGLRARSRAGTVH